MCAEYAHGCFQCPHPMQQGVCPNRSPGSATKEVLENPLIPPVITRLFQLCRAESLTGDYHMNLTNTKVLVPSDWHSVDICCLPSCKIGSHAGKYSCFGLDFESIPVHSINKHRPEDFTRNSCRCKLNQCFKSSRSENLKVSLIQEWVTNAYRA